MTLINESRYPLLEIQKRLLYEYLGNLRFDDSRTKIVIRLKNLMVPNRCEAAWRNTTERHPILRTKFVWRTEEPYQEILPSRMNPFNFHVSEKRFESYGEVFSEMDRIKIDTEMNTFHVILFNHSPYFLGFLMLPMLMDGWSVSIIIRDFLQRYYFPQLPDVPEKIPYEDVLSMLLKNQTAVSSYRYHIKNYLRDLDRPCMVANCDKHFGGFTRYESTFHTELMGRVTCFCGEHGMMPSVLIYAVWALVLFRHFGYHTISFGTTFSNRGNAIPLDIAGQFVRTVPFIRRMDQQEKILHLLSGMKEDLIDKLTGPKLNLWDYVPMRKYPLPVLFDSLVVIENYPMMQHNYTEVMDFRISEKAGFNMVFGVFLNQGSFVFQYHRAHFKDDEIRTLDKLVNDYLQAIVNERLTYIGDIP